MSSHHKKLRKSSHSYSRHGKTSSSNWTARLSAIPQSSHNLAVDPQSDSRHTVESQRVLPEVHDPSANELRSHYSQSRHAQSFSTHTREPSHHNPSPSLQSYTSPRHGMATPSSHTTHSTLAATRHAQSHSPSTPNRFPTQATQSTQGGSIAPSTQSAPCSMATGCYQTPTRSARNYERVIEELDVKNLGKQSSPAHLSMGSGVRPPLIMADVERADKSTQCYNGGSEPQTYYLLGALSFLFCPLLSIQSILASIKVTKLMKAEDYAQAAKQDTRSICCGCWAVVLGMLLYGVGIYVYLMFFWQGKSSA